METSMNLNKFTMMTSNASINMSDNILWTSSIVPLAIMCLHYAREACVPARYRKKVIMLYDHAKAVNDPQGPKKSSTYISQGTGTDENAPRQADGASILYEDEHLIISSKGECPGTPKQVYACKWAPCNQPSRHVPTQALWQFSAVGGLYLVQWGLFHTAAIVTIRMVEEGILTRLLAASTLLFPAAELAFTSSFLAPVLNMADEFPDGLSWMARFLGVKIMGSVWLLSWLSLLIPIWGLLTASADVYHWV